MRGGRGGARCPRPRTGSRGPGGREVPRVPKETVGQLACCSEVSSTAPPTGRKRPIECEDRARAAATSRRGHRKLPGPDGAGLFSG